MQPLSCKREKGEIGWKMPCPPMIMRIEITQKDIEDSEELLRRGRSRSACCPVSLAAKRAFGTKGIIATSIRTTGFYLEVGGFSYTLPREAQDFIYKFDNGEVVKPFEFEVEDNG